MAPKSGYIWSQISTMMTSVIFVNVYKPYRHRKEIGYKPDLCSEGSNIKYNSRTQLCEKRIDDWSIQYAETSIYCILAIVHDLIWQVERRKSRVMYVPSEARADISRRCVLVDWYGTIYFSDGKWIKSVSKWNRKTYMGNQCEWDLYIYLQKQSMYEEVFRFEDIVILKNSKSTNYVTQNDIPYDSIQLRK